MTDFKCCPFARSGGLHGEDCTYSGKSHCPYRMAAEGLHVVYADYLTDIEIERQAERVAHARELNEALAWAKKKEIPEGWHEVEHITFERWRAAERKVQKVKDILASDAFPGQTLILIRDVVYK